MKARNGGARRNGYSPNSVNSSRCGFHILRGHRKQIEEKYEDLARTADTDLEAENFRQHAEHWRRSLRQEDGDMFLGDIGGKYIYRHAFGC